MNSYRMIWNEKIVISPFVTITITLISGYIVRTYCSQGIMVSKDQSSDNFFKGNVHLVLVLCLFGVNICWSY